MKIGLSVSLLILAGWVSGCGKTLKTEPEPLVSLLLKEPQNQALIELRRYLPKAVTCPETLELDRAGVSWAGVKSCRSTDIRRGLRFQDLQRTRLIRRVVHMGFDRQWLEVKHNNTWIPIGRGVSGLHGKGGARILEGLKSALERLGPGSETPHHWTVQAQPFLFL